MIENKLLINENNSEVKHMNRHSLFFISGSYQLIKMIFILHDKY